MGEESRNCASLGTLNGATSPVAAGLAHGTNWIRLETVVPPDSGTTTVAVICTKKGMLSGSDLGAAFTASSDELDTAVRAVTKNPSETFIFEVAETTDDPMVRATADLTLISLSCVATGSQVPSAQLVTVMECTNAAASCVTTGLSVTAIALLATVVDVVATNASIDAGDWWGVHTTSLTTAADFLNCTVEYTQ